MSRYLAGLMVAVLMVLVTTPARAQKDTKAKAKMAAAWQKEHLEHDLPGAIKLYKEVADKYGKTDPASGAEALLLAGDAYRQRGAAESRAMYEQVVKRFPNQKDAVAAARARLGGDSSVEQTIVWTSSPSPFPGTISPDGRFYSHGNRQNLFLHDFTTDAPDRNLTNHGTPPPYSPAESVISPDGKRIAYTSNNQDGRYELRVADLTGTWNPRQIFDNPDVHDIFLNDWSRDGKWLAVEVHRIDNSIQIGLIPASGGPFSALMSLARFRERTAEGTNFLPTVQGMYFSPDSRYIGYDMPRSTASEGRDVYVLAVDGSGARIPVVEHRSKNQMVGWSPDGRWILFRSDRNGTVDLYAVGFSDGRTQGQPQRLKANIHSSFHPIGWTGSGTFYFLTNTGYRPTIRTQLASIDFTAGRFASTPVDPGRGYQENIGQSTWSSDGKRLAYVSRLRDREDYRRDLMIRATDTGATRQLNLQQSLTLERIKAWTPDGRSLLVVAWDPQGRSDVYLVDAETGAASAILGNRPGAPTIDPFAGLVVMPDGLSFLIWGTGPDPSAVYRINIRTGEVSTVPLDRAGDRSNPVVVSPSGSAVYYIGHFPAIKQRALIERDLATGNERELIRGDFTADIQTLLSPDGQYVATTLKDSASKSDRLLVVSTAGGAAQELLRSSSGELSVVSWTPDSTSLVLQKNVDAKTDMELWQISLAGQQSATVHLPARAQIVPSPDGRSLIYSITEPAPPATVEVVAMKNFLPKPATK